ncbi:MAG: cytochrome b N-terminal domain-containing protein [Pseudohongiella sp.]|nr:cytochrome b N-terminal domain-containing protein [Pseudohongiella sp.]MDO9520861.1 cytochrome b N-terminal domain-containing protein [Pseudohongiella sp.]MDP2128076.1 cytochrome b N-terminal domain-containing protein [Pseudohongiella sp.]
MSDTKKQGFVVSSLVGLRDWTNDRLPIMTAWEKHMSKYYAPKNFNFWYFFGVLSLVVLVIQLLSGIFLTMHYTNSAEGAFASVEYIMRDVEFGWLLRYIHSTGASAFFVVVYLHMFRGLMYGSYKKPRELIWVFGMAIYLVLMMEGFMGYVLPWGQMSYWGANVIVSLVGAIPVIGEDLLVWVRGDFLISGATLNRFFALHVVALPIILIALVVLHLLALHEVGSNNPDGIEIKKNKDANGIPVDGIPFHPFYTVHDLVGITVFFFVFCFIVFFVPEMGGYFLEPPNFQEANSLVTPAHVPPVWYFTPFYSMLRAVTVPLLGIDAKFWGLIVMFGAIAILFVVPWLDRSPVKSIRYKGWYSRIALLIFTASFLILGYLGTLSVSPGRTVLAQITTVLYFLFFFLMPWYTKKEQTFPEPTRVTGRWITNKQVLLTLALLAALVLLPLKAVGAEVTVALDKVDLDLRDEASLQRGFNSYMNYCHSCHSLKYARFERTADDLGIPHDLVLSNLAFGGQAIGELMDNTMRDEHGNAWFGVVPPDLTLVARVRGPDWLYTYLRSFYTDTTRIWGVNNSVFPNVGMPNVLYPLQGEVICSNNADSPEDCELSHVDGTGQLSPDEFDAMIYDMVNFLYYIGEPIRLRRQEIGVYVLGFLAILFVLVTLLNREYWRRIH